MALQRLPVKAFKGITHFCKPWPPWLQHGDRNLKLIFNSCLGKWASFTQNNTFFNSASAGRHCAVGEKSENPHLGESRFQDRRRKGNKKVHSTEKTTTLFISGFCRALAKIIQRNKRRAVSCKEFRNQNKSIFHPLQLRNLKGFSASSSGSAEGTTRMTKCEGRALASASPALGNQVKQQPL